MNFQAKIEELKQQAQQGIDISSQVQSLLEQYPTLKEAALDDKETFIVQEFAHHGYQASDIINNLPDEIQTLFQEYEGVVLVENDLEKIEKAINASRISVDQAETESKNRKDEIEDFDERIATLSTMSRIIDLLDKNIKGGER